MNFPFFPLFITFSLLSLQLAAAEQKPNILVIVSDDQGYVDAGFQGGKQAVTPHLDKLAASGLRCTQGYVTYPVCSPSRAGLLTGRHQAKFGHENNPVYDPLDAREGLPLTEKLIPQYLQAAGYRTAWVGKWHQGASPAHVPWKRGFERTFGFLGGGHRYQEWKPDQFQYTLPLIRDGQETTDVPTHLTQALGKASAEFIRKEKANPWFLYLALNAPHTPHEPTAERDAKFAHIKNPQRRRCLAQISLMDDAIGQIISSLNETGQMERTLIFFFSDNGGAVPSGADNGPLRGHKGQLWEGGIRVPFLISWPQKLPAGKVWNHPVSTLDVLPTALAAAGAKSANEAKLDGIDLISAMADPNTKPSVRPLYWRLREKEFAVREGDWKLLERPNQPAELYNLTNDPQEKSNVGPDNPEPLKRLTSLLVDWKKTNRSSGVSWVEHQE